MACFGSRPSSARICPERSESAPGLRFRSAHHDEIVGVADEHTVSACPPAPVEPVQVDVAEQRRDDAALWRAADAAPDRPFLHHPRTQQRAQQLEDLAVDDPFLDRLHQPFVRDRLKAVGDVRLDQPAPAPVALIEDELQGIVRRPPRLETFARSSHS